MTQGVSDRPWQAEARTAETKQFIRDIKRITCRKFTAEEKIRIVLEGFRRDTPYDVYTGRHLEIIKRRKEAKSRTLQTRKDYIRTAREQGSGL